jgi:pimeloyl-ACP methyl ester carboxylesterase
MLAFAQAEAERQVAVEDLWAKLRTETLIVQPADDLIVLAANTELMAGQLGPLATVVTIPNSGHALLPEQPEAVAAAILSWVRSRR